MRSELGRCPHGPLHVHRRFCSVTPAVAPAVAPAAGSDRFERREVDVPRGPKGKRVVAGDGYSVAGKNSNGVGSVYFEPPSTRADGTVVRGRWRATYVDLDGKIKRVSGPTRALAESRRDELVAALGRRRSPTTSRFSITTVAYLVDEFGHVRVIDVGPEVLTAWQSALLDRLAPYTVLSCRKACRQIFAEAVKMGLIATNPFDLVHAPRAEGVKEGRALNAADARKLVTAAAPIRSGVAVTLLFCQGWRVSEVLGLAWDDLDLEAGTAHIRRAATHSAASGVTFGPTKTSGAQGLHHLAARAAARPIVRSRRRPARHGPSTPTRASRSRRCSPTRWVGSSIGRRSPRSSSARPNVPGSTQRDWPHTPVDEPSSPRCTPKVGSTCQMSLVMWVIRTSPRPPAT
jgi:integrase